MNNTRAGAMRVDREDLAVRLQLPFQIASIASALDHPDITASALHQFHCSKDLHP